MLKRIYGLDLLRCIAILLVVQLHGHFLLEPAIGNFPYVRLPDGVELFFVLSGFLIGTILIRSYEQEEKFSIKGLFQFWKRRWIRTLPNYYLVLILNAIAAYFLWNGSDFNQFSYKFFFFLQNFSTSFHSFFWESWSLSIEEWFYLALPFLLLLLTYLLSTILSKKIIFLICIITLIIIPLLYRAFIAEDHSVDHFHFDIFYRKMVITRLDSIVYGVFFAWLSYYYPLFWKKIRYPAFIAGIIYLVVLTQIKIDINNYWVKVAYFPITSFCCSLFLPLASSIENYTSIIGKGVTHISKISYSMYLLHLGLIVSVIQFQVEIINPSTGLLWFAIYFISTIVASTLLYRYFEKPILDRR